MFKTKGGYRSELQMPENNEVIWQHKKINRRNKKWRKCAES